MANQAAAVKAAKAALKGAGAVENARTKELKVIDAKKTVKTYSVKTHESQKKIDEYNFQIKTISDGLADRTNRLNNALRNNRLTGMPTAETIKNDPYWGKDAVAGQLKAIDLAKGRITTETNNIANYKNKIDEAKAIIAAKGNTPPPKPTDLSGAFVTDQGNGVFSKDWKYNAPMVKSAYFNSAEGLSKSLVGINSNGNFIDAGKYQDALKAWTNTTGGRGTLQMDRKFVKTIADNQNNTVALDPQMYGFKFLYNPKEVAMSWNQLMTMDPVYESSGQDAYTAISAQLASSTIELTLLLNRIGDFAYINENGFNSGFGNEDPTYAKFLQDDLRQGVTISNPYPDLVDLDDIKEIYKKGTMYDLEYLFKTINGPHATFISMLNGQTADRGWIRPTFVELHLGAGMRYRVRVIQLAVTHSIFNSRMVPILSSVKLVLGRFNDGPESNGASFENPYGNHGGQYVGSRFVPNP